MDFSGQVVLVTGGSGGIGRAAVRMLAERGARVLVGYHSSPEAAAAAVDACAGLSGAAEAHRLDVRDQAAVDRLVETVLARYERIDALINCVGAAGFAPFSELGLEQWHATLATNLDGVYHTCRAVLRPMMRRRYGRIVNVAALHGAAGSPLQADYSAATGGLLGLTRAIAREAAAWSITANAVAPGLIATPMLDEAPPGQRLWGEQVIALRRIGRPEEVAAAALFLASPLASYITGQTLTVDGGWRMT